MKKEEEPLTNEMISSLWNLELTKTMKRLNKFTRIRLLEKIKSPHDGRVVHYVLNELYFQKGKTTTKPREKFVKLFQNKLSDVINEVEKINELKNRHRKPRRAYII
ncbi:winged helix DNA-binding protein [Oceanobacillus sp. CF4.6]|uniref:winged helix DNA-binding protein n=1 Tax=Oceanobacillus sp. CF4.6 TaxID=3373080 RepID=UPI003EE46F1C